MIKDVNGRFDYYSVSTRIRLLFTLGLWINWKQLVMVCFFVQIKMSYYWFNGQKLLQRANDRYHICGGKEKTGEYYIVNEVIVNKCYKQKCKK